MADTLYANPNEVSANPARWYPDGILENYVNPVPGRTYRGPGAYIPPPSDYRLTILPDAETTLIAPYLPSPGEIQQPGPTPLIATHEGNPIDTSEPRSLPGLQATSTGYTISGRVNSWVTELRHSPIAALFLGLAGVIVFSEVVLRNRGGSRRVSAGAGRIGSATAGVGRTAEQEANRGERTAIDSVNAAIGGAVEAVEGAAGE